MMYNNYETDVYEGLIVKNYKEMCRIMGENAKTGKSKQIQQRNWKRFFSYIKEGQKFIITEIYDTPFPSDDARKHREGLYLKYIECLLMDILLHKSSNRELVITRNRLLEFLGMVNNNYLHYYNAKSELVNVMNDIKKNSDDTMKITMFDVNQFYLHTGFKLNDILSSALRSMTKRRLIDWRRSYVVRYKMPEEVKKYIADDRDRFDNTIVDYQYEVKPDSEDAKFILDVEANALKNLGLDSVAEVLYKGKCKAYQEECDRLVHEVKEDWDYFFPVLHITHANILKDKLVSDWENLTSMAIHQNKTELNKRVITVLNTKTKSRYEKNKEEIRAFEEMIAEYNKADKEWGDLNPMEIKRPFELPDNYLISQSEICDFIIKI